MKITEMLLRPYNEHHLDLAAAKALKPGDLVDMLIGSAGARQAVRGIVLAHVAPRMDAPAGSDASHPCKDAKLGLDYGLVAVLQHTSEVPPLCGILWSSFWSCACIGF